MPEDEMPKGRVREVTVERASRLVLAGDLAGFHSSYVSGNQVVLEEMLRRFYVLSSLVVRAAGGELVKYTGDGFLAVWDMAADFRENARVALGIDYAAFVLSAFVRVSRLDLGSALPVHVRQAMTVEPAALRIGYREGAGPVRHDYVGKMINLAFRIQALPGSFPFMAAHQDFLDVAQMYLPESQGLRYAKRPVSEEEVDRVFKGTVAGADSVFTAEWGEDEYIDGLFAKVWRRGLSSDEAQAAEEWLREDDVASPPSGAELAVRPVSEALSRMCADGPQWMRNTYRIFSWVIQATYADVATLEPTLFVTSRDVIMEMASWAV